MFIRAGSENHWVVARHFLEALDQIGYKGRVCGAQVRGRVYVVNRSRQVIFHRVFFRYAKDASARISLSGMPLARASVRQSSYSGLKDPSPAILIFTLPCGVSTSCMRRAFTLRSAE